MESNGYYWCVDLYNSSFSKLKTYDLRGTDSSKTMPKIRLSAGTYYLKVAKDGSGYSSVDYTIKINLIRMLIKMLLQKQLRKPTERS